MGREGSRYAATQKGSDTLKQLYGPHAKLPQKYQNYSWAKIHMEELHTALVLVGNPPCECDIALPKHTRASYSCGTTTHKTDEAVTHDLAVRDRGGPQVKRTDLASSDLVPTAGPQPEKARCNSLFYLLCT